MSDAVKIRLEVACNCYVMREQCLPCDARYEIERLEAKVGRVTEERDHQTRRNVELFAEVARLRTALEKINGEAVVFLHPNAGLSTGEGLRVVQRIAREALE